MRTGMGKRKTLLRNKIGNAKSVSRRVVSNPAVKTALRRRGGGPRVYGTGGGGGGGGG